MKKLITIADWAADGLACQEVRTAVQGFLRAPTERDISFVPSTPSTIHAGYLARQVVETEDQYGQPLNTVVLVDVQSPAELLIIRLKSGIHVLGPHTGNVFSFLLSTIEEVFTYPGLKIDSHFPARDAYARVAAHLMESLQDEMELEEGHLSLIPGVQDHYIGPIDSYGNIKTTIQESTLKEKYSYGDEIDVSIHETRKKVQFVSNPSSRDAGRLVIFPGASGDNHDPLLEIADWGDDAVSPGMKIKYS
ncbi:SAM-dependent chlorinase/fluorinase [Candidatus Woesebacteria bacterium]|nr:SAM-dependent chlorinase/fluorinase [Candidatus Woesebacteria bacterium]